MFDDMDRRSNSIEALPTAMLIYRNNTGFTQRIPNVEAQLRALGWEVKSHVFPAGTPENDIQSWLNEHQSSFGKDILLTDWTCGEFLSESAIPAGSPRPGFLDRLDARVVKKAILDMQNSSGEQLSTEEIYATIIGKMIENGENMPKMVLIVSDNIGDHLQEFGSIIKPEDIAVMKRWRDGDDSHPEDEARVETIEKEHAERMAGIFAKAGIPKDRIVVKSNKEMRGYLASVSSNLDIPDTWIIIDRHARAFSVRDLEKARKFKLPAIDFVASARELMHIPESSNEIVKDILEEGIKAEVGEASKE